MERRTTSGSDTSDNDEDKTKDSSVTKCSLLSIPHKRKDSGGNSSDNDGPSTGGGGRRSANASGATSGNSFSSRHTKQTQSGKGSPCAKKKYGGTNRSGSSVSGASAFIGNTSSTMSCSYEPSSTSSTMVTTGTNSSTPVDGRTTVTTTTAGSKRTTPESSEASYQTASELRRSNNGNNNNKEESLRVRTSKLVESSLARLSNFSLASQTSSISSKSSAKYSGGGDRSNMTPRSSQHSRRSVEDNSKFSKAKLIKSLKKEMSELSGGELTDSDCGSLHSSIRLRMSAGVTGSNKEYSVITEEQSSYQQQQPNQKRLPECCNVM